MSTRPEPFWLEVGRFCVVPVVHYRHEFAREVRRAFLACQPQRVAVELPPFLLDSFGEAVARFPRLTTVTYAVDGGTLLLPVEPTDAFAEAVRSAREGGLPVHAIDKAMLYTSRHQDRVPDSCSLTAIGLKAFWEAWEDGVPDEQDRAREEHMAQTLLMLSRMHPEDRILVVVGIGHVKSLVELLQGGDIPMRPPIDFRPGPVQLVEPAANFVRGFSEEIPFLMALYELERGGPGGDEFWKAPPQVEDLPPEDPRPKLADINPMDLVANLESLLVGRRRRPPPLTPAQKKALIRYLQGLQEHHTTFDQFLDQFRGGVPERIHLPEVTPPPRMKAFRFQQCNDRRPQLLAFYQGAITGGWDRQQALELLLSKAAEYYQENSGDHVVDWQRQVLFQFVRNYARLQGRLLPGLYELLMCARGVADDNYSYEVWDLGGFYPWSPQDQSETSLPLLDMDADQLRLAGQAVKEWRFHRKLPRLRQRLPFKNRAKEEKPGDWADAFENASICSYPPEDVVIEDYARYLQKKAIQQMSLEKARVEPFTTSLLDGIEMRETVRNWHERKIFVQEQRRVKGGVGAIVLVFDEDAKDQRYPWRMTWHGEHAQESDMAFYATPYTHKIVGEGISRCEYGGLLMTYPNRRLADVWRDVFYHECRHKGEILLLAGLEYGLDKHVVYVASQPPRSFFRTVASRLGKRIVYIPIGSLSPQSIKRIRVFHVLAGHHLRAIAKDFIW